MVFYTEVLVLVLVLEFVVLVLVLVLEVEVLGYISAKFELQSSEAWTKRYMSSILSAGECWTAD